MPSSGPANLDGWKHVAWPENQKDVWRDRAQLAATFLRPEDVVCDLGAGARPLKTFLPDGAGYIPVDCVDTLRGRILPISIRWISPFRRKTLTC